MKSNDLEIDARHLLRSAKRFRNELETSLKDSGLDACEFFLLDTLAHQGGMTQGALSSHTGVDRTALVAILDELEEKKYVTRSEMPEDRRANLIEVTQPGLKILEKSQPRFCEFQGGFFSKLSLDEKRLLNALLEKLV